MRTLLSEDKMIKLALAECVEMLGEKLVVKHKHLCCCTYGMASKELFKYSLGLDTKEKPLSFGGETPMEFHAHVVVNSKTGEVKRDYKNSVLPIE